MTRIISLFFFGAFFGFYLMPTTATAWECWEQNGSKVGYFAEDKCLPYPDVRGEPKLTPKDRTALYMRCRIEENGVDEYTNNCCDHLTNADASTLCVCSGHKDPVCGLERDIKEAEILNYADIFMKYSGYKPGSE